MKRPSTAEVKAARDRVRSKGPISGDVQWLSVLAIRDPECSDCVEKITRGALALLHLDRSQRETLSGIVNGAFIAGLHIGLEIEP